MGNVKALVEQSTRLVIEQTLQRIIDIDAKSDAASYGTDLHECAKLARGLLKLLDVQTELIRGSQTA